MKKRTIVYCSLILTALFMNGCGCGRTMEQTPPSSLATQDPVTPETSTPAAGTAENSTQEAKTASSIITEAEAKEIALSHANLVEEEVTFSKFELDRNAEVSNYDIEFYTEDRLEYDYEIDAYTGEIISYEWDEDELFLE